MRLVWQSVKDYIRLGMAEALYRSNVYHQFHKGKVIILTYHRVLSNQELAGQWIQPGMYVETEVFSQHMLFLRQQFHVLSFQELLDRWDTKQWDHQQRYCVITFDDGWLDNYRYAYPILKELGLPATIFLPTDFVGSEEWFWPEKLAYLFQHMMQTPHACDQGTAVLAEHIGINARYMQAAYRSDAVRRNLSDLIIERCKALDPIAIVNLINSLSHNLDIALPHERVIVNWEEVAEMSLDRISFGSHSCSHRILTQLSDETIKTELEQSQCILRDRSRNYVPVFCYPNGDNNERLQALVRTCGYKAATGVRSGAESSFPQNKFDLRRISIHNDVTSTVPLYTLRIFSSMAA